MFLEQGVSHLLLVGVLPLEHDVQFAPEHEAQPGNCVEQAVGVPLVPAGQYCELEQAVHVVPFL